MGRFMLLALIAVVSTTSHAKTKQMQIAKGNWFCLTRTDRYPADDAFTSFDFTYDGNAQVNYKLKVVTIDQKDNEKTVLHKSDGSLVLDSETPNAGNGHSLVVDVYSNATYGFPGEGFFFGINGQVQLNDGTVLNLENGVSCETSPIPYSEKKPKPFTGEPWKVDGTIKGGPNFDGERGD